MAISPDPLVANELKFKEILYLCLEELRATKAALYLMGEQGDFINVTSYGFNKRDALPKRYAKTNPLVEHLFYVRKPFYTNTVAEIPGLGEMLVNTGSSKLLAAPLYFNDRIVGFVDARDKAGGALYTQDDSSRVESIVQNFLHLLGSLGLYGSRPAGATLPSLTLASDRETTLVTAGALEREVSAVFQPPLAENTIPPAVAGRESASQRSLAQSMLALREVEVALLALLDPRASLAIESSRREVVREVRDEMLAAARQLALREMPDLEVSAGCDWSTKLFLKRSDMLLTRSEIHSIQAYRVLPGVTLSLAFNSEPPREFPEILRNWQSLAQGMLGAERDARRYRSSFKSLVNKLLEPELRKFTALKNHSFNVGRLARMLCQYLSYKDEAIEQITVAAILHDIGMKEIHYAQLYEKPSLTAEEVALIREHPKLGATMLEDVGFPYPVAELVLHHHERYDGSGYPNQLRGQAIPLGARIIGIIEAFDAMTSRTSYRPTVPIDKALDIVMSKGGTQFDPSLAESFREMMLKLRKPA